MSEKKEEAPAPVVACPFCGSNKVYKGLKVHESNCKGIGKSPLEWANAYMAQKDESKLP